MARSINGGWDFVKKGEVYQYKEDGWIAMVEVLDDDSDEGQYSFRLKTLKASAEAPNDIFDVSSSKTEAGIFSGMAQLYPTEEYMCEYPYVPTYKYTWRDLYNFMIGLDEEFMDEEVGWIGEERGGKVQNISCFDEDMINPSGDGIEPVSVYEKETNPEYKIDIDDEPIVFRKGHPIIWVD